MRSNDRLMTQLTNELSISSNPFAAVDHPVGMPAARGTVPLQCPTVNKRKAAVPPPESESSQSESMKFSLMMNKQDGISKELLRESKSRHQIPVHGRMSDML